MAKEEAYCVLTLPLYPEPWQVDIIEKRFAIVEHLKNQLIGKELRRLKNLERTKKYRELNEKIKAASKKKDEKEQKELYRQRKIMLKDAGFSEYAFKDDMAGKKSQMQKHFAAHITAQIAHAAAKDVWQSFNKMFYGSGQTVHYHKRGSLYSVACEKTGNGMDFDGTTFTFRWSGGNSKDKINLNIKSRPAANAYEQELLETNPGENRPRNLKYLRIIRKWSKTRYKYYLQLTLKGRPPQKGRALGSGRVGIDIGPQTVAIVSQQRALLLELADRINANHAKKIQLERMMDRSKRATNPENFDQQGRVRKPPGRKRLHWHYSKRYLRLRGKHRELERKNAAIRRYQHNCLANLVLELGDQIFVEQMNFSALQRRAKETKKDDNGRFKKKKRFGKSLANKAPATFLLILKVKAQARGASYQEVDTKSFRASQLDHCSGEYKAARLGERSKKLANGDTVQRDLYSAFLLMNSNEAANQSDLALCRESYPRFKELQDREIQRIKREVKHYPRSFGF